ncbi:DUF1579 family protein [Microvirga rosea]|uniref:DUF1579 family protein n=1 Tax=Microvirga rosea TaxID=2715425 RepID=UPI001D0B30B0|nr:DUF1579 family protein [Microvirga rosea]MCB8818989.1 DUF1579 domain-containing protein [Microvirga rosea]
MTRQPGAENLRLQALAGLWIGEEVLLETPWMKGGTAVGHVEARAVLDGFVLEQEYRQERQGQETFRAKGLFTFDADRDEYRLFWFDNLGFPPAEPAGGTWDGDTLTVLRRSPRALARHTFAIRNAHEYELAIANSWDGGATWMPVMTGFYRRRSEDRRSSVA